MSTLYTLKNLKYVYFQGLLTHVKDNPDVWQDFYNSGNNQKIIQSSAIEI
jgi:hypothetical protein